MNRIMVRVLSLASSLFLLASCATLGEGHSKYDCPGMPNGARCESALDAYQNSNGDMAASPWHQRASKSKEGKNSKKTFVINKVFEQASPLPKRAAPVPLLMPAKVMRIWFAPWRDKDNDEHFPQYVFTKVMPSQWSLGSQVDGFDGGRVFHPLETVKNAGKPVD